jgi:hypothetical protein
MARRGVSAKAADENGEPALETPLNADASLPEAPRRPASDFFAIAANPDSLPGPASKQLRSMLCANTGRSLNVRL